MGKRILVTGASGFLGRGLVRALLARGDEVHGVSRPPPPPPRVHWHPVDLSRPGALDPLLRGQSWDAAFHLANPSVLDLSLPVERYRPVELGAVQALLQAGTRLVVVGSGSVYAPSARPHREEDPTWAPTPYAAAKLEVESGLSRSGADWVLARMFGVFGSGEAPSRLVPTLCRGLLRGEAVSLSAGTQVRDMLFLEDAAAALVALLGVPARRAYNVGSGQGRSVRWIAETLEKLSGRSGLLRFGPPSSRPHDCPHWVADISRIRSAGWAPGLSWEAGLARALEHWKSA